MAAAIVAMGVTMLQMPTAIMRTGGGHVGMVAALGGMGAATLKWEIKL